MSNKTFLPLPTGNSDFTEIRAKNRYYVDKSPYLKTVFSEDVPAEGSVVADGSAVLLFTRPRRFGKTLLMDMFESFLKISESNPGDSSLQKELFKGLKILEDKEFCEKYMGRFPVIFISLKDVGGTTVKLGLFTVEGELLDKWEIKTYTENEGERILPDVAEAIKGKIAEKLLKAEEICGIGVGVPAPVDKNGAIERAANVGWMAKEIKKELEELTGFPCVIGNDANVAALGEMWKGAGEGEKDLIMVTLGTGVGGGIIIDGHAVVGAHGAGGEIGHITVRDDETEACGCGRKGCLEQYASATGLVRLAKRYFEKNTKNSILTGKEITAKEVFDAAKAGDAAALEITEEFGAYLGQALVNLAATVDPAVFVIGGGVSKAGDILLTK